MKRFITTVAVLAILTIQAIAQDFTFTYRGQTLTYTITDEQAATCMPKAGDANEFTAGNKVSGSLTIPKEAISGDKAYKVVGISPYAFYSCKELTSVVFPETITEIGEYAFMNCSNLAEAELPGSVVSIGTAAFSRCHALMDVCIPASVKSIGSSAFYMDGTTRPKAVFASLESLCSIKFSDEHANPLAFAHHLWIGGKEITELELPATIPAIGKYAFTGCTGLLSVQTGSALTSIGGSAFLNCTNLAKVGIGERVAEIGENAFSGCKALETLTFNAENCLKAGSTAAPAFPPSVGTLTIGDNVKRIPAAAFAKITNLKNLSIGSSVGSIGDYSFFNCKALAQLTIPASVATIGKEAFANCAALTKITLQAPEPPVIDESSFLQDYDRAMLSVPDGTLVNYLMSAWSLFKQINGGELTTYSADGVTYKLIEATDSYSTNEAIVISGSGTDDTVSLPEKIAYTDKDGHSKEYAVNAVGYKAFADSPITRVIFPLDGSLTSIGDYAFAGSALEHVETPPSLLKIGNYAFFDSDLQDGIILNEGLTTIGENAFNISADTQLRGEGSVALPTTLVSVGADAFGNRGFESVSIKDIPAWCGIDFANAGSSPFSTGSDLYIDYKEATSLQIPETQTEIKQFTFSNIRNIKEIALPKTITSIASGAFMGCSALTTVNIPAGVEYIGENAFNGCERVTDVVFADGTLQLELGANSFSPGVQTLYIGRPLESLNFALPELRMLTVGNTVEEIAPVLCKDAAKLETLTLGSNLRSIGFQAFSGCVGLQEVVVPPMVESIGASAFADIPDLATIVLGPAVKKIGEKAFSGAKALSVSITAQTPPAAANSVFSTYDGKLYLQGEGAATAFREARTCWNRFKSEQLVVATDIELSDTEIAGEEGATIQLTASLRPADVSLPQLFWRSTNPEIATVDHTGLVTLHADLVALKAGATNGEDFECKIIVESLYSDGPSGEIDLNTGNSSGIEGAQEDSADIDWNAPYEVYDLAGLKVGTSVRTLRRGIYIVRQGSAVRKIAL